MCVWEKRWRNDFFIQHGFFNVVVIVIRYNISSLQKRLIIPFFQPLEVIFPFRCLTLTISPLFTVGFNDISPTFRTLDHFEPAENSNSIKTILKQLQVDLLYMKQHKRPWIFSTKVISTSIACRRIISNFINIVIT